MVMAHCLGCVVQSNFAIDSLCVCHCCNKDELLLPLIVIISIACLTLDDRSINHQWEWCIVWSALFKVSSRLKACLYVIVVIRQV